MSIKWKWEKKVEEGKNDDDENFKKITILSNGQHYATISFDRFSEYNSQEQHPGNNFVEYYNDEKQIFL